MNKYKYLIMSIMLFLPVSGGAESKDTYQGIMSYDEFVTVMGGPEEAQKKLDELETLVRAEIEQKETRYRNIVEEFRSQSEKDMTPLMYVSKERSLGFVQVLNENKATVNAQNNKGRTALMFASFYGQLDIVDALVEAGADMNVRDHNGRSALYYAYLMHQDDVTGFLVSRIEDGSGNSIVQLNKIIRDLYL